MPKEKRSQLRHAPTERGIPTAINGPVPLNEQTAYAGPGWRGATEFGHSIS